jgi:hypothetical protein
MQPELSNRTEIGFSFDANAVLCVAYNEYDSICAAWEKEEVFWEGEDEYGEMCKIKLVNVVSICQNSGASRIKRLEDSNIVKKLQEPII